MSLKRTVMSSMGVALLTAFPLGVYADSHDEDDDEEIPFDEAFIFFELNNTDGDLGIHAKIDGDAWKKLEIEGPNERRLLKIKVSSTLRKQGLTELFFESAEPTFDELDPVDFFARFPEGLYEIEGVSNEGEELESESEITHLMPAPAQAMVNGEPFDTDCDDDNFIVAGDEVVLSWAPVTMSHPELGRTNEPVEIVNYQVVVEIDETPWNVSAILPPDVTQFEVPEEILDLDENEIKFEILARETSYNQTAVESCFLIEEEDEDEE